MQNKLKPFFTIDFFELMFLAESVIPPNPIARSVCFDRFSEIHYHNMNDKQRLQFFEHVVLCSKFDINNEQCSHFYARFNPKNQYIAHVLFRGEKQEVHCYMFNKQYITQLNKSIVEEYILKVVRVHDSEVVFSV
jgi:hypothetical protein